MGVESFLNGLLDPIRQKFETSEELKKLVDEAYPKPEAPKKEPKAKGKSKKGEKLVDGGNAEPTTES